MKVAELIKELQSMPQELDVVIFDIVDDSDDAAGLYPEFGVSLFQNEHVKDFVSLDFKRKD